MDIIENYFTEFILLFVLCSILYAQYLFFSGNELYGLFVGLWAPTVLGIHNAFTNRHIRDLLCNRERIQRKNKMKKKSEFTDEQKQNPKDEG